MTGSPTTGSPLSRVDPDALFATDTVALRARAKAAMRTSAMMLDASRVDRSYPLAFEADGRVLRYAHFPASGERRGLVVLFHGHNAFVHLGPAGPWRHFDVLAPWDTFGWNRQGSWFWGERGDPFVAGLVARLIDRHRDGGLPLFCAGMSMGGFAAIWHGIGGGALGVYAQAPQVDLRAKIREYGPGPDNPYGHLAGERLEDVPDLAGLAEDAGALPPLFLIQHQFDPVNPFADHGLRLVDVYARRRAWLALRVWPAIGHGGDGSHEEAQEFFLAILDRRPPAFFPGP